jgi:hypothetical protein
MSLQRIDRWTLTELPRWNRAVLAGAAPGAELINALNIVLRDVPDPDLLSPVEAQRLVVNIGLAGVSVARHFQEQDPARKATPEEAFAPLAVGANQRPFLGYFAALADRTATGHPPRDSYASLVRWNVPTTSVAWDGQVLAVLPGVFTDGSVRTYTGDASERRFFHLLKNSETVERAVNDLLEPISDTVVDFFSPDGRWRVRLATALLEVLRRMSVEFAALPAGQGLHPDYFLDVFRQFAVHWRCDDIPPSGALDPEAPRRDLLLGIALPDYRRHIGRIWPALLVKERAEIDRLLGRPTLPSLLLRRLDSAAAALRSLPVADLTRLVNDHPVLADWYLLLDANARVAGAHLMLSRTFLFRPQRARDEAGLGDRPLVSNRRGTTGMDEGVLERLTRARRDHELAALRRLPRQALVHGAGDEQPPLADVVAAIEVRTVGGTAAAWRSTPPRCRLPGPNAATDTQATEPVERGRR